MNRRRNATDANAPRRDDVRGGRRGVVADIDEKSTERHELTGITHGRRGTEQSAKTTGHGEWMKERKNEGKRPKTPQILYPKTPFPAESRRIFPSLARSPPRIKFKLTKIPEISYQHVGH